MSGLTNRLRPAVPASPVSRPLRRAVRPWALLLLCLGLAACDRSSEDSVMADYRPAGAETRSVQPATGPIDIEAFAEIYADVAVIQNLSRRALAAVSRQPGAMQKARDIREATERSVAEVVEAHGWELEAYRSQVARLNQDPALSAEVGARVEAILRARQEAREAADAAAAAPTQP